MENEFIVAPRQGPAEIRPGLWLGDQEDAAALAAKGFVPVCVLENFPWSEPSGAHWVPILIGPGKEGLGWRIGAEKASHEQLDVVVLVLSKLLASGHKVILHCAAGIERSPLAMAWYLSRTEGITIEKAYDEIRKKRPIIADRRLWLRKDGHDYYNETLIDRLERLLR